jgi:hypothetical protein
MMQSVFFVEELRSTIVAFENRLMMFVPRVFDKIFVFVK